MANQLTALIDLSLLSPVCTFSSLNSLFPEDELHMQNDRYEICLCGCLLNVEELLTQYKCKTLSELILRLYKIFEQDFIMFLKGSYTLLIFDKAEKSVFITNDLLSKNAIYYYHNDSFFAMSNKFSDLTKLLKSKNIPLETDNLAATMVLSQGFLWDDVTWARDVKYLKPFDFLSINKNGVSLRRVDIGDSNGFADSNISYGEAIDEFNKLFKNAVALQYKKTKNSGYLPLSSLSAGMDSRAVVLCAHGLGYKDITCFTYAQSGSVDDIIAKKIACDYGFDHVFYQLDCANFILDIDDAFALNEGEQTYCGATGAKKISQLLNSERHGIIHTGVLGGELMGDLQHSISKSQVKDELSDTLAAKALGSQEIAARYQAIMQKYSCQQQLDLQKHLRACQNFSHMTSRKFLSLSPFLDEEVYLFLASLPLEYKHERKLYVDWMNKYLPNKYITTHMYGKVKSNELLRKSRYALRILKGKIFGKSKYDMNPFDYWAKTMPSLVGSLQDCLKKDIDAIGSVLSPTSPMVMLLKEQSLSRSLDSLIKATTVANATILIEQAKKEETYEHSF